MVVVGDGDLGSFRCWRCCDVGSQLGYSACAPPIQFDLFCALRIQQPHPQLLVRVNRKWVALLRR